MPRRRRAGASTQRLSSGVGWPRSTWLWAACGVAVVVLAGAGFAWRGTSGVQAPAGAGPASLRELSLAELLAGHSSDWRLARLKEYPAVVVIEFPSLAEQGATLNRIAALFEKAGAPRDRVLDDAELAALIARSGDTSPTFYQGHDYQGAELSRFYALARAQGLQLSAQELRLQRELLAAAASPEGDGYPAALISFTAIQPDDPATPVDETVDAERRASVLRHEASHGRFYTRPVYREHCRRFWREVLTEPQRERVRTYLASIGYDRNDEELMLNEAQAFMMNTADERAFPPEVIGMTAAELAALRRRFWQTLPAVEAGRVVSGDALPVAAGSRP